MAIGRNPAEAAAQVQKLVENISEAFQSAGQKLAATGTDIGTRAVTQAQQNTSQMFDTLKEMAAAQSPTEASRLYAQFLTKSTQQHAQQLREIGELLAKTSGDIWKPVTSLLGAAMPPAKD